MDDPRSCNLETGTCDECQPDLSAAIWNTEAGDVVCSTLERPVKAWHPDWECPRLTVPCDTPPPPPPGEEGCWLPDRIPEENFQGGPNPEALDPEETIGKLLNSIMAELTGCAVGSTCRLPQYHPDEWMKLVEAELQERSYCTTHHRWPNPFPGGQGDQISVSRIPFCEGRWYGNWQVYNYGGNGSVRWHPNGMQDGWRLIDWPCDDVEPPLGKCPEPHPDLTRMKFNLDEKGSHLDTTWTTNYQCEFCESIGMGEHGGVIRCGCPVRPECSPGDPPEYICHDRQTCEMELCDQKWQCNGVPVEGWRGNYAQTDCRGHWRTWCSAPGSTAVAEGTR